MTAYATSEFGLHSLLTVVDIVSGAMTAACYIPLAKALDLWGRAEGFMLMVGMLTLGMVLQAAAPNLAALCAGRVSGGYKPVKCVAESAYRCLVR
jgi:predicted MFS family arabinose efflux permease